MASGGGSNAEAIARHFAESGRARFVAIVSDRGGAGVHARAERLGIPSVWLSPKQRTTPGATLASLRELGADLVVLAGYLRLVPADVVAGFPERVINVHPALLPKFGGAGMYGRHVHEAVHAAGEAVSGMTVHLADEAYDRGRVLFQATTPLRAEMSPGDIAAAVLTLEHRHYPLVIEAHLAHLPSRRAPPLPSP